MIIHHLRNRFGLNMLFNGLVIFVLSAFSSCVERQREDVGLPHSMVEPSPIVNFESNGIHQPHNGLSDKEWRKNVEGRVVRIIDGDTFVLIFENDYEARVRLDGIDCPERKQPFSQRAKQALSDLIFSKNITVYYNKKDGFGRILGVAIVDGVNVNHEMVRRGMAWHYVAYSDDPVLSELESEARRMKIGLWSDPNPVPPWEFRRK